MYTVISIAGFGTKEFWTQFCEAASEMTGETWGTKAHMGRWILFVDQEISIGEYDCYLMVFVQLHSKMKAHHEEIWYELFGAEYREPPKHLPINWIIDGNMGPAIFPTVEQPIAPSTLKKIFYNKHAGPEPLMPNKGESDGF